MPLVFKSYWIQPRDHISKILLGTEKLSRVTCPYLLYVREVGCIFAHVHGIYTIAEPIYTYERYGTSSSFTTRRRSHLDTKCAQVKKRR